MRAAAGRPETGCLSRPASGAGVGVEQPTIRPFPPDRRHEQRELTKVIEDHLHQALTADFERLPDADFRRVAFFACNRLSTQKLTSWPSPGCELTDYEFRVTMARYWGLPCPGLAPYVGRRVTWTCSGTTTRRTSRGAARCARGRRREGAPCARSPAVEPYW